MSKNNKTNKNNKINKNNKTNKTNKNKNNKTNKNQIKKIKQKGSGLILPFKNDEKNEKVFMNYIKNSSIRHLNSGSYGMTFLLQLNIEPPSWSDWTAVPDPVTKETIYINNVTGVSTTDIPEEYLDDYTVMPINDYYKKAVPNHSYGRPVMFLIVKMCVILNKSTNIGQMFRKNLSSVLENNFQNEINAQIDATFKTIKYLEPISPIIVYANILSPNNAVAFLNNFIANSVEQTGNELSKLRHFFELNSSAKLGIIGMELAENCNTLSELHRECILSRKFGKAAILLNIGRYNLLRLALETGYSQNDFHKNNMLIVSSKTYFSGPKYPLNIMVIDYGRAVKIPKNILSQIKELVDKKQYVKALSLLCSKSFAHKMVSSLAYGDRNYGWVCGDYNLTEEEYELELPQILEEENRRIEWWNKDPNNLPKKELFTLEDIRKKFKKPVSLTEADNTQIEELFELREQAIEKSILTMRELNNGYPNIYPQLPISDSIKGQLYKGLFN